MGETIIVSSESCYKKSQNCHKKRIILHFPLEIGETIENWKKDAYILVNICVCFNAAKNTTKKEDSFPLSVLEIGESIEGGRKQWSSVVKP